MNPNASKLVPLVPVRLESGLVVWHTREQYARYHRNVDREAARQVVADLDEYVEKEREKP